MGTSTRTSLASSYLALFVGAVICQAASAQERDVAVAWRGVTDRLQKSVETEGVVGASLGLVHRGKLVARWHHGYADLASERKVDEDTIFHWASITKTFTGVALLQLRDRDKVSLSDPIVEYLPELRGVHNPFGDMDEITLEHLLSHSAGFRNSTWPFGGSESWQPHEPTRWEQIVAMVPYTRIGFPPGTRYSYSNLGILFLGRVIEIVSGEPYEVYVEKNVLRPLGMGSSYFDRTPYHLLRQRSNNYSVVNGTRVANGLDFDTGITVSNSGLNAPIPDMARFLGFLCGAGDETSLAILEPGSIADMWRPRQVISESDGLEQSMGLVFFVLEDDRARYVGHTGSQKSFISFVYFRPESGVAAICAFNTVGRGSDRKPDTGRISNQLRNDLLAQVFPLFPDS